MTTRRLATTAVVLAGAALALPVFALAATGASEVSAASPGGDVVSAGRRPDQLEFQGVVLFTWVDRSGVHRSLVQVRGADGLVRIGGPGGPQGVEWPADAGAVPSLVGKYDTSQSAGPVVAGRPTTAVEIRSPGGTSESLALDQSTGLILSRVELNDKGSVVRSMQFQTLTLGPARGSTAGARAAAPSVLASPSKLSGEYTAPSRLAEGYQRLRAEEVAGGVRVVYSDGIHGLSVFEQPGHLSTGDLPVSGTSVRVGGSSGRSYRWAGGVVLTWQAGPTVFTAVGDGPSTDVVSAVRSIPQPQQPSLLGHLRSLCRDAIDTLSGSR